MPCDGVGVWVAKLGGSLTKCDHIIYVYIYICICASAYICVCINIIYIYVICPLHNCICMIIHVPKNLDYTKDARYSFPVTIHGQEPLVGVWRILIGWFRMAASKSNILKPYDINCMKPYDILKPYGWYWMILKPYGKYLFISCEAIEAIYHWY
jgi:hypothetical protein